MALQAVLRKPFLAPDATFLETVLIDTAMGAGAGTFTKAITISYQMTAIGMRPPLHQCRPLDLCDPLISRDGLIIHTEVEESKMIGLTKNAFIFVEFLTKTPSSNKCTGAQLLAPTFESSGVCTYLAQGATGGPIGLLSPLFTICTICTIFS